MSDLDGLKDRIRLVLATKNMSERAWSLAAGVGHSYVSQLLRGKIDKRGPSQGTVKRLAEAANVNAHWLWTGTGHSEMYLDPAKEMLRKAEFAKAALRGQEARKALAAEGVRAVKLLPLKDLPDAAEHLREVDIDLMGVELFGKSDKFPLVPTEDLPERWALRVAWEMTGPPVDVVTEAYVFDMAVLAHKHTSPSARLRFKEWSSAAEGDAALKSSVALAEFIKNELGEVLTTGDRVQRTDAAKKIYEFMKANYIRDPAFLVLLKALLGEIPLGDEFPPHL